MKVGFLWAMWKKICGSVLCISILLCGGACTSQEPVTEVTKTPVVATVSESGSLLAARDYCRENGYDIEELYNLTDCVVAVENGKYDYLICDEYDEAVLESFALSYVEECAYKSQYSLCFNSASGDLCEQFNTSVNELTNNGTIKRICDSYKGIGEYENAGTVGNPLYILFPEGMEGYSSLNDEGEAEGIEIDIITALCNNLGYTPVFISAQYDESFDLLANGEADLILGVDYNSILGEDYIMSQPYFTVSYKMYAAKI